MKPIQVGDIYLDRKGRKVRILATDAIRCGERVVIGLARNEDGEDLTCTYHPDGHGFRGYAPDLKTGSDEEDVWLNLADIRRLFDHCVEDFPEIYPSSVVRRLLIRLADNGNGNFDVRRKS